MKSSRTFYPCCHGLQGRFILLIFGYAASSLHLGVRLSLECALKPPSDPSLYFLFQLLAPHTVPNRAWLCVRPRPTIFLMAYYLTFSSPLDSVPMVASKWLCRLTSVSLLIDPRNTLGGKHKERHEDFLPDKVFQKMGWSIRVGTGDSCWVS